MEIHEGCLQPSIFDSIFVEYIGSLVKNAVGNCEPVVKTNFSQNRCRVFRKSPQWDLSCDVEVRLREEATNRAMAPSLAQSSRSSWSSKWVRLRFAPVEVEEQAQTRIGRFSVCSIAQSAKTQGPTVISGSYGGGVGSHKCVSGDFPIAALCGAKRQFYSVQVLNKTTDFVLIQYNVHSLINFDERMQRVLHELEGRHWDVAVFSEIW